MACIDKYRVRTRLMVRLEANVGAAKESYEWVPAGCFPCFFDVYES